MFLRRCSLLLLGVTGGLLFAVILSLSVKRSMNYNTLFQNISMESLPYKDESERKVQMVSSLQKAEVVFPYSVPGTTICIKEISSYDGPFLEDGTDREVVGVAALLVTNFGEKEILQAYIELNIGQMCLSFFGEHIPSGATVLLLERGAQRCLQKNFTSCNGWQIQNQNDTRFNDVIFVEDYAMGTLIVTNRSELFLENIRIYYKTWFSEQNVLVGGIAYCIEILSLEPGQTESLYPYHYASGYSVVVSVTADQSG